MPRQPRGSAEQQMVDRKAGPEPFYLPGGLSSLCGQQGPDPKGSEPLLQSGLLEEEGLTSQPTATTHTPAMPAFDCCTFSDPTPQPPLLARFPPPLSPGP